jgi:hypothetical protein
MRHAMNDSRANPMWRLLFHLFLVPLLTCLVLFDAADSKEEPGGFVVRNTHPRTADAPSKSRPAQEASIKVINGLLSMTVRARRLALILADVSHAGGVPIMLHDAQAGNQPITLRFQDLPLDQGLLRILKGYDAFFFYGADQQGVPVLNAVWVYAKGLGRGVAPIAPELWASTREIEKRLDDPNPEIRAKAIETLASRRGAGAFDAVITGLKDDHSHVRTQALYGAVMAGLTLPGEILSTLALTDPSADVRFLALQALAGDPNVQSLAEQALNDPSPQVQHKAGEILGQISAPLKPEGQEAQTDSR